MVLVLLTPLIVGGSANKAAQLPQSERPVKWATPLKKSGLPNLSQVSPILFRGAQPSHEGMLQLEQMGVKTVINLRGLHDDEDRLSGTKLSYVGIRFHTWHPEEEDVVRFLKIVTDPRRAPVLVHCQHGADRTGTMIAVYRIIVQGWSKAEAIREMTEGGFGFHPAWSNLPRWIQKLNIDLIKSQSGIKSSADPAK